MNVFLSLVLVLLLAYSGAFPFEDNYQAPEGKLQINATQFVTAEDELMYPGMLQGWLKPTAKKIPLKRSGNFFLVPINVGNPSKMFSVKLDTSSSFTFVFSGKANGLASRRQDAVPTRKSNGQMESHAYIGTSLDKDGKVMRRFTYNAFDGSVYDGNVGFDSVEVGGIKMKKTAIGIVDRRSERSTPTQNDNSGFDGVLGLGLTGGVPTVPPIFKSMIHASRKMAKTKIFSLYICSDGHAGQLYLGSADKRNLLAKGSKIFYVPMSTEGNQGLEIKLRFEPSQTSAIQNRVAIIDSASPFIVAPKKDIVELFGNVNVAIHWTSDVLTGSMSTPMFLCSESEKFMSLELGFVDTGGTAKPVAVFTGTELLGTKKVTDTKAKAKMCELLVKSYPPNYGTTWRLGLPFLQKAGFTVFDIKNMQLGFGPAKHSNKICGEEKHGEKKNRRNRRGVASG